MTKFDIAQFTADLPVLSQQFQPIQDRIQTRQQIVREGRRPRRELFGLMRGWEPISVDERYRELQSLIRDYQQVIQTLHTHQQSYQSFFGQLKTYVNSAVSEEGQRILKAEEKRLILQQRFQGKDNPALLAAIQAQQDQLTQSVQMLGQSALLLLRKIELFTECLDRLARDKQLQSEVLDRLVEDLRDYQEVYQLQKEIDQIQKDVAEMADVALNFEELMREHLGPFQSLIDQVVKVDKDLFHSVEEIEEVTRKLLSNQFGSLGRIPQADNLLLDFLIRADGEKNWLISTLSQVRVGSIGETLDVEHVRSDHRSSEPISIQKQVENIQTFVALQLDGKAYQQAVDYLQVKEYRAALENLDEVIARLPDYADAYYQRALAYLGLRNYQSASKDLDRVIELQPDRTDARRVRDQIQGVLKEEARKRQEDRALPQSGSIPKLRNRSAS